MKSRVAEKIKLQSIDELLGVPEIAGTQEIELGRIHSFPNHPFKVLDDEKMETLVDSIRENGVLNPVIVRPDNTGNYEMISGHRRLHAAELAGLKKIPAIVKEMTDDEAIIKMVDANIQREEILPSERAWSLKMKMDALSRQGKRTDLTSGQNVPKLTSEILGEEIGMSGRQVKRFVRLTELISELLELVDNKKLGFVMAVDISYFDKTIQQWIYEYIKENGFLKPAQITLLKESPGISNATQYDVISILNRAIAKKKVSANVSLSEKKLDKYFPPHYSSKQREEIIIQLLEQWSMSQEM